MDEDSPRPCLSLRCGLGSSRRCTSCMCVECGRCTLCTECWYTLVCGRNLTAMRTAYVHATLPAALGHMNLGTVQSASMLERSKSCVRRTFQNRPSKSANPSTGPGLFEQPWLWRDLLTKRLARLGVSKPGPTLGTAVGLRRLVSTCYRGSAPSVSRE